MLNVTQPTLIRIVLYCIVLYCIVLYCIVLYCIVLYCIVLYFTSKHSLEHCLDATYICACVLLIFINGIGNNFQKFISFLLFCIPCLLKLLYGQEYASPCPLYPAYQLWERVVVSANNP